MGKRTESYWPADTSVALQNRTVGDLLREAASDSPDAIGLVAGVPGVDRRWTFAEMLADAERVALALLARFSPGDRVAVWAPNLPEWVLLEFGAALAGVVLVTVNPAYQRHELAYVLGQSGATGIVAEIAHSSQIPRIVPFHANVEDAAVIRGLIDRAQTRGMLARGPELVRDFYKDVPVGSLAWALARSKDNLPLPNGLEIPVPEGVTWVGSLRFAGALELKAQAIAASDADAQKITESLNTLLAIFHSVQSNSRTQGMDADVKNVFDSLQVTQDHNRAIVRASVPAGFLQKMASH